jgi:REP element-mobilizing transposase RayT
MPIRYFFRQHFSVWSWKLLHRQLNKLKGTFSIFKLDEWLGISYDGNMPRKSRLDAPGAVHHLIVRGIDRGLIFRDEEDRDRFIKRLGGLLTETGTACLAWALLANHFHLLVRSGHLPLSGVMRRLLTGYAISFNRRHRRWGHLFQNRYKSILCQQEPYLLELVRYIHLNPLRARLVEGLDGLDEYRYCGHSVLMGRQAAGWQDTDSILNRFGRRKASARRGYRGFLSKGIELGRRPELTGGGLIRSLGGWDEVKAQRRHRAAMKGDERILGDSEYVAEVLRAANERLRRKYQLKAQGLDVDKVAERVAALLGQPIEAVWAAGKHRKTVAARFATGRSGIWG